MRSEGKTGKRTREGDRNGVGHRERMKRGSGIKDRDCHGAESMIWSSDSTMY